MTAGGAVEVGSYDPDLGPLPAPPKSLPWLVYGLTLMAVIGGFLFGYDTGVVSGAMLIIRDQWNLNDLWQELIVAVTVGSAAVFSLVAGYANERFGRKPVILVSSAMFVIGSIIMAASWNKEVLLVGRVVVGAAIGFTSSTVPAYLVETCPGHIRGRMVVCFQLMLTFGLWMADIMDGAFSYLSAQVSWRLMLGFAVVPATIQLIGFFFMPESPRWQVSHGKIKEAEEGLKRVSGRDDIAEYELKSIIRNHEKTQKELELEGAGGQPVILTMLQRPSLRKSLLVACLLQLFQQLCGINTVMYYSATIVEMGGIRNPQMAIWMASVTAAFNFFCTFIGFYLVEKLGRRKLLLGSVFGVILCLGVLGTGFALIAQESPSKAYNELPIPSDNLTQLSNSTLNACFMAPGCDACSYLEQCGFCYDVGSGSPGNGSCLPANPAHIQSGAMYGRCKAVEVLPSGSVFANPNDIWAYGWCPSQVSWLPIVGMALYLCCFSAGFGPMPWTISAEIFPNWARASGTSIATATNWTGNLIISLTFLTLARTMTRQGAFFLYAGITAVGIVIFYFIVPETKGASMEEVQRLMEKPWCGGGGSSSVEPTTTVSYEIPGESVKVKQGNGSEK